MYNKNEKIVNQANLCERKSLVAGWRVASGKWRVGGYESGVGSREWRVGSGEWRVGDRLC